MSDNAHYLYRIQPTRVAMLAEGCTPEEDAVADAHFAYLERLSAEGVVVHAGRTLTEDEASFGVVILATGDEAEARAIMEADPAVVAGVMRAVLFPYRAALGWGASAGG